MFRSEDIKYNLLGCFEIFLFMPRGVERFEADWDRMIRSFVVPVILMPFVLVIVVWLFPEYSASLIISLTLLRTVLAMVMFWAAVYFMVKQFDRHGCFYKFVVISNWMNVNAVVLIMPILIGLALGFEPSQFEVYAVFTEIVGYIYTAFVLTYCFRIPWEMGGFLAVVSLAINENLWDVTDYIRDMSVL